MSGAGSFSVYEVCMRRIDVCKWGDGRAGHIYDVIILYWCGIRSSQLMEQMLEFFNIGQCNIVLLI